MSNAKLAVSVLILAAALCLPAPSALAQGQITKGEKLDPSSNGPSVVEDMEDVIARAQSSPPQRSGEGKPEPGTWVVPSIRGTYYPHSGTHNLVNKWGDTCMGIDFPEPVDVCGAYFAGQAGEGAWTTGVRVIGFRNGEEVQHTDWFDDIDETPSWFEMDLHNVDRIEIQAVPVLGGAGWYALDDLTFTTQTPEGVPVETVLDFEDVPHHTTLTGSGYAGLTWEIGTGDFLSDQAIHPPQVPPGYEEQPSEQPPLRAAPRANLGTAPDLVRTFQRVVRGDAGQYSYPPRRRDNRDTHRRWRSTPGPARRSGQNAPGRRRRTASSAARSRCRRR